MVHDRQLSLERYNRGARLHDARQFEAAIEQYMSALEADPTHDFVYNERSAALMNIGKYEEACQYAQKAYEGRPDHAASLGNFLGGLCKLQRHAEGRKHLEEAIARGLDIMKDFPPVAKRSAAEIYYFTGAVADALPLYEAVLHSHPADQSSLLGAAWANYNILEIERALVHFKNGRREYPDCPFFCLGMAQCYNKCGLPGMVAKYRRMALERDPNIDLGALEDGNNQHG